MIKGGNFDWNERSLLYGLGTPWTGFQTLGASLKVGRFFICLWNERLTRPRFTRWRYTFTRLRLSHQEVWTGNGRMYSSRTSFH